MATPSIQQWLELVADYEDQPGRPLKAFAEEHGVDAGQFRDWLKRVSLEGAHVEVPEVTEPDGLDDILVSAARLHGGLTISRVSEAAGVGRSVARRWLIGLVEEGRLLKVGKSSGQRFVIPEGIGSPPAGKGPPGQGCA